MKFVNSRQSFHINIFVKKACFPEAIAKSEKTESLLNTLAPKSNVPAPVSPYHLSETLFFIFKIFSFESRARFPGELSITMFHIRFVVSYDSVRIDMRGFFPFALAIFHAVVELTRVEMTVFPLVLAIAFSFAPAVLSHILVSRFKAILALAMSQTSSPLTFIHIAIRPGMLAESLRVVFDPLSDVFIAVCIVPDAIPLLEPILKFTCTEHEAEPCHLGRHDR